MLKLFLWLRYLRKKKIVFLSIAAVALSVALLVVVDSLFTGFIKAVRKDCVAGIGDVILMPAKAIPEYDVFLDRLTELDGVEAAAPFLFGGGLLYLETGDVREVMIQGVEPQRETKFTDLKGSLLRQNAPDGQVGFEIPGYPDDNGGWLGIGIVAEPDEKTDEYDLTQVNKLIGKRVILTTTGLVASDEDSEANSGNGLGKRIKRRVVKLRISDIAFTRTYYGDKTLYLPFRMWHKLQFGDDEPEHTRNIKIKLKDGVNAESMKKSITMVWQGFAAEQLGWDAEVIARTRIATEQVLHSDYFAELRKQMRVLLLIFGVVCSVAILLIFCIFYMIVMTKQKDIAIIKSCGATSSSAALIFAGFGACVGVVGSGLGIILGTTVIKNINTIERWVRVVFGLKIWRSSSYMLKTIPNQVNWSAVWPIVLAAIVGCCLGALIPAIVAARVKPVKILRYE